VTDIPDRSEHSELATRLNELMTQLYASYRTDGRNVAVFLHQAINMHADDGTMRRIIADIEGELVRSAQRINQRAES